MKLGMTSVRYPYGYPKVPVNSPEGVGIIEAPRSVLSQHYRVDESGAMKWANLIVATGHNNLAINRSTAASIR
jgi:NAD-reducing hydrogenase large subunit